MNVLSTYRSKMRSSFDLSRCIYSLSRFSAKNCDTSQILLIDVGRKTLGTYCGREELCNMLTKFVSVLKKTTKKSFEFGGWLLESNTA